MSGMIKLDTSNPEKLLEKKSFEPVPTGVYVCEVENELKLEDSKSSDNKVIKVELRIVDDGEYKGRKIFDNLVVSNNPETKEKTEWKIAHFALSCGVVNKDNLDNIDLSLFKGSTCQVKVGVKTDTYEGETRKKNVVREYLFED